MNRSVKSAGLDRVSLIAAAAMAFFFALICYWYYAPTEPMTEEEVDQAMAILERSSRKYTFSEGLGPAEIDQMMVELRRFAITDDGRPFYMANIMKLRKEAEPLYPEGYPDPQQTIEEADEAYGLALLPLLMRMGAHPAYVSTANNNALGYGATPDQDGWDQIALLRYRSRRDFFRMLTDPVYSEAVIHKFASMRTILVTPTHPFGLPLNPMPDLPVLLFFILALSFTGWQWRRWSRRAA
jgi:hypothetical protein